MMMMMMITMEMTMRGDDMGDSDLPLLIITWRADVDAVGGRLPFVSEPLVGHARAGTGH